MEIEAKYRIATVTELLRVLALPTLDAYHLAPAPADEIQTNRYYDSADAALARARHGLRVRQIADQAWITLKGPASVQDGVQQREEWEFPGAHPQPQTWSAGPARDRALSILGERHVHPTVEVLTTRRVIVVSRANLPVAEIALDRGEFVAGERREPFCELEIELYPDGTLADIAAIAAALSQVITLHPEPRSKLSRAIALRDKGSI